MPSPYYRARFVSRGRPGCGKQLIVIALMISPHRVKQKLIVAFMIFRLSIKFIIKLFYLKERYILRRG